MQYEQLPTAQRFAVLFHDGSGVWPAGWPAEENPLQDGVDPPKGYELRTGGELNSIRAKLHTSHAKACDGIRAENERRAAIRRTDDETAANIAGGFEFPAGSGRVFSMSIAAQLNVIHDGTDAVFPVNRSTIDGAVIDLDAKQFAAFAAAMRAALRGAVKAGHETKGKI